VILITPQYLGLNAIPKITWGSFRGRFGDHIGVGIFSGAVHLKVNAAAGNMRTPSTVGSFSLTKNPTFQVPKNLPVMIYRVRSNQLPEYCLHFQFAAKSANHPRNG